VPKPLSGVVPFEVAENEDGCSVVSAVATDPDPTATEAVLFRLTAAGPLAISKVECRDWMVGR
jgi:hypothetical protein